MNHLVKTLMKEGPVNSFMGVWRASKVLTGSFVGADKFGNKYFENTDLMLGNSRNVRYARKDFDASQIPGEWHRWMTYMTDDTPNSWEPKKKWQIEHVENLSGTSDAYVTYSTTKDKVETWTPPQ
eukprot:m.9724 g.9724  ORF g.9724 m.9724 type:complete len:125 (-) comp6400_c0_seq1:182-556(-)